MSVDAAPRAERERATVASAAKGLFDRCPRVKPMLVLTVLVLVLNVLTLRSVSHVSEIDEREHIDYLLRGSHGRIGQNGDLFTQETLRELCSRGSEIITAWPPCRPGRLDPNDFSPGGVNASTQSPFYYLGNGLGARAARAVTPGWESLVTWGRAINSLWLLLGFYLALRAGDLLGVRRWPLVAALVLVAALPTQLHASTTVNPDATSFLSGAAMLLAALVWERRGRGVWMLAASGALVVFEPTNTVGLLVVAAYLGVRALAAARGVAGDAVAGSWRRYGAAALALVLGGVVALGAWEVASRQLTPVPEANFVQPDEYDPALDPTRAFFPVGDGVPWREILSAETVFGMTPPVVDIAPPAVRSTEPNATWYLLFTSGAALLLAGVLVAACLRFTLHDRLMVLGAVTLGVLLVAAPAFRLYNQLFSTYVDKIVPRFGISALPAIAIVLAASVRRPLAWTALGTLVAGLYLTALATLL